MTGLLILGFLALVILLYAGWQLIAEHRRHPRRSLRRR
jgi:hypothetical protein